jgi:hypothetical protein
MAILITATYANENTLQNLVDDLVNIGLPTEKFFSNTVEMQVKIIAGPDIEAEITEVVQRHNPSETETRELEDKISAKVLTAVYEAPETLKNVTDDLINIGLPAEEIFADKKNKTVKVIAPAAIEREIVEVLNRHNPVQVD